MILTDLDIAHDNGDSQGLSEKDRRRMRVHPTSNRPCSVDRYLLNCCCKLFKLGMFPELLPPPPVLAAAAAATGPPTCCIIWRSVCKKDKMLHWSELNSMPVQGDDACVLLQIYHWAKVNLKQRGMISLWTHRKDHSLISFNIALEILIQKVDSPKLNQMICQLLQLKSPFSNFTISYQMIKMVRFLSFCHTMNHKSNRSVQLKIHHGTENCKILPHH